MKKLLLLSASLLACVSINATPVNTTGANGEATLATILGISNVAVDNTQVSEPAFWSATSFASEMIIEIAGYAGGNSFGIYKQGDASTKDTIFTGSAIAGATSSITIDPTWLFFNFFLTNQVGETFYSDVSLNSDQFDHFVFYSAGVNSYYIGIEDIFGGGDWDYNDMVVKVTLNVPTPTQHSVPDNGATVALMGLGLCALAAIRRRK